MGIAWPGKAWYQGCHTDGQRLLQQPPQRGSMVPALLLLCDGQQEGPRGRQNS